MWEIFSFGAHPKAVIPPKETTPFIQKLEDGWRLPKEAKTRHVDFKIDPDIYDIMKKDCWEWDPEKRLCFVDILPKIQMQRTNLQYQF